MSISFGKERLMAEKSVFISKMEYPFLKRFM